MFPLRLPRPDRRTIFAISALLAAPADPLAAGPAQARADRAVATAVASHRDRDLRPEHLAVSLLDLSDPARPDRGSFRGDVLVYPASVIKLCFLAATHRWMEDGRIADTPEVRRAMRDMIVESSNDATHYLIDLLTGTTSGPELPDSEIRLWFERRNAVTEWFASLGYTGVLAHKKPWGDGPYGRESQAIRLFDPKRNMLTTGDTVRLLAEIATGKCVSPARSAEMMTLLARDPSAPESADNQALFTGPALPPGTRLWSKAGWTSQTRHDAAYVELPDGRRLVYAIFTEKHARTPEILRTVARALVATSP